MVLETNRQQDISLARMGFTHDQQRATTWGLPSWQAICKSPPPQQGKGMLVQEGHCKGHSEKKNPWIFMSES